FFKKLTTAKSDMEIANQTIKINSTFAFAYSLSNLISTHKDYLSND
ncbi:12695_t:CDS:2, partial [Gigaspora margarita]